MRFLSMVRRNRVERAAPNISKQHLEDTLARDIVVQSVVKREKNKVVENNFGPKIHRAYGGLR